MHGTMMALGGYEPSWTIDYNGWCYLGIHEEAIPRKSDLSSMVQPDFMNNYIGNFLWDRDMYQTDPNSNLRKAKQ